MMLCTGNTHLSLKVSSFSNRSLIMLRTGSMGTDVNNAVTLYELRHSPGRRVTSLTLLTKSLILCMWCGNLPTMVFSTLAMSFATPEVTEPLLDTIGLRGYQF